MPDIKGILCVASVKEIRN